MSLPPNRAQDGVADRPYVMPTDDARSAQWPSVLQREIDVILRQSEAAFFLADIYAFCEREAPAWLQPYFDAPALDTLTDNYDLQFLLDDDEAADLAPRISDVERLIFSALSSMVLAMHAHQQPGHQSCRLVTLLLAAAMDSEQPVDHRVLMPLINLLQQILPTGGVAGEAISFVTPFSRPVTVQPAALPSAESPLSAEAVTTLLLFAVAEHNRYLSTLLPDEPQPGCLSNPLRTLDALLGDLLALSRPDQRCPHTVTALFQQQGLRQRVGAPGASCWPLSDAEPYALLRDLEGWLPQLGLQAAERLPQCSGVARYRRLTPAQQRRVLRIIDDDAWRQDLRRGRAGRQAQRR